LIIVGIDPGLASIGYSFLEISSDSLKLKEAGIISTNPKSSIQERLFTLRKDLFCLLEKYQPSYAGIELIYFTKNIKTGISVSHARGVILETIFSYSKTLKIYEYTPTKLKQTLLGFGKGSKQELQIAVSRFLNLAKIIKPDDAADATALCLVVSRELKI